MKITLKWNEIIGVSEWWSLEKWGYVPARLEPVIEDQLYKIDEYVYLNMAVDDFLPEEARLEDGIVMNHIWALSDDFARAALNRSVPLDIKAYVRPPSEIIDGVVLSDQGDLIGSTCDNIQGGYQTKTVNDLEYFFKPSSEQSVILYAIIVMHSGRLHAED